LVGRKGEEEEEEDNNDTLTDLCWWIFCWRS